MEESCDLISDNKYKFRPCGQWSLFRASMKGPSLLLSAFVCFQLPMQRGVGVHMPGELHCKHPGVFLY